LTVPAVLTLRARRELARALERIAEDNPDAAQRPNEAVLGAARLIGGNPAIGVRRPRLASPRYRFWSIPRYHYLLAYTDATDRPASCGSCIPRVICRACWRTCATYPTADRRVARGLDLMGDS